MKLETIAVHAGGEPDPATGAMAPPIHLSTTFEHGPAGERPHGYMYIREGSPTETRLEEALAAIEGAEAALVFSSGMAAGAAYLATLPPGSHVLSAADMADLEAVRRAIRKETRLLWGESPSNPLMKVVDLAALAEIAKKAGARFAVDGT